MTGIPDYIQTLESYVERSGARLVRKALPDQVHGRVSHDQIVLRPGLEPEQEFIALVHELAHWLAHREVATRQPSTVLEYEAEAVEALVMSRLGLPWAGGRDDDPTDDLLSASVTRVRWASGRICDALGFSGSKPKSTVDV